MNSNTLGQKTFIDKISVNQKTTGDINMAIPFIQHSDKRGQKIFIDSSDLYYNPSNKTLHVDNISGAHSNLIEGEGIKITNNNTAHTTTLDVNFDKNTSTTTSISNSDKILVQDGLDFLKTISGADLRETLLPTILTDNGLDLTAGVLKIDINDCASQPTPNADDIFIFQLNTNGTSKKIKLSELITAINSDTTYNNGSNITIDSNNNINLDTDLTSLNSLQSETNTDLKIQSSGTGDILLIATPNTATVGYVHLARADTPSQRFNTIAYSNDGNNSYINFSVHYTAGLNNLTREVLKLNSNLNADFSGDINIGSGKSFKIDNTVLSGSSLNYSTDVTINTEIDSKQDILTFGKSSGDSLKLEANIVSNDILLMGLSNVIGKTYSEFSSLLGLNNVENIGVSTLGGSNLSYNSNKLNVDTTLINLVKLSSTSNNLTINTTTNNDILFEQNNTAICKVGSTGFTVLSGKQYFGDGSQLTGITGTIYNNGSNISIDGSNNINLGTTLSNMVEIVATNDLSLKAQGEIISMSGFDGGTVGGKDHVFKTNNGTSIVTLMTLSKDKNISGVNSITANQGYFTTVNATNSNLTGTLDVTSTITSDNSFKLNSHKVLFNSGLDEGTNPYLNARVLQNTSSLYNDGMYINYQSSGTPDLRFYSGSTTPEVPKMMIKTNGNVGINTVGPGEKLSVDGRIVCNAIVSKSSKATAEDIAQNSGHGSGTLAFGVGTTSTDKFDVYFYIKSNVTNQNVYGSFSATEFGSDDRRKHNEKPITNALDSIMKLQCETYDKTFIMKDKDWSGNLDDEASWLESGLIAQDVYQIPEFREYVKVGTETISWDINYNSIFTYNIRATQELKIENDKLKKKNEILINKIYEMELKISLIFKKLNL
jgi:hypothetical protein